MPKDNRKNPEMATLHARAADLLKSIAISKEPPTQRERAMASIYAYGLDLRVRRSSDKPK